MSPEQVEAELAVLSFKRESQRLARLRCDWYEYHMGMAARHRASSAAIIKEHEEAAASLEPLLPREYPRRGAA